MGRPKKLRKVLPSLWRTFRCFGPHVRKQRALLAGSFVALFFEVGLKMLEPWPLKYVFDFVISPTHPGGPSNNPWIDSLGPTGLLTLSVFALVVIVGMRASVSFFKSVWFALVGNRVLTEVRGRLYRHLQALSLSFHAKAKNGDLVVRVIGDVGLLKQVLVTSVMPLLGSVLVLTGMMVVMFWMNWRLALLSMCVVPLFWLSTTHFGRRIGDAARQQRKRESAMAATAAESLGAIKTVQALSLEENFANVFAKQNKKSLKEGVKAKRLAIKLQRTVDVLIAIATALVLWYGAKLVLRHEMTPGDLLVFLAYLKYAFKPVQDFAKYTGRLAKASAAGERVVAVLEQIPEIRDLPNAKTAPAFQGDIRFENVCFGYQPGAYVLNGLDFEVRAGQHVAVVGPSGIGKTTMIGLISRLYDPGRGRVLIDGHDIRDYTLESLRGQISTVLQETLLFAGTVKENIACGKPGITDDQIKASARLANADTFIEALSEGYDTVIGERGATLSGGQRQRIAIARAAVREAPIVLLDEPTTGLDEKNHLAVSQALRKLCTDRTTFIVSHDTQLSAMADVILYMENGRVLETGTHEEMMKRNGQYAALYRLQQAPSTPRNQTEDLYVANH